MQGCIRS